MENSMMFSDAVPQTSRTILFEKFNSSKPVPSLIDLVTDEDNVDDDKLRRAVENELSIRSFDDFLTKFDPVIYEVCSADAETKMPVFTYTSVNKGGKPKRIVKEVFYKMVQEFIRMKYQNGKSNLDTFYEKIDELLAPEKVLEETRKTGKKYENLMKKYQEAVEKHRTEEAKKYQQRMSALETEFLEQYKGDALEFLPLAIAVTQEKIDENITKLTANSSDGSDTPNLLMNGEYAWDESGTMTYKELEMSPNSEGNADENQNGEDFGYRGKMLELSQQITTINQSPMMQLILVNSYTKPLPIAKYSQEDFFKDAGKLCGWANTYKEAKESLYQAIISLVQKVLDVEMYFRHATQGIESTTPEPLIVANCTMEEAMQDNGEHLKRFLKVVNNTASTRIFFAILPPAEHTAFQRSDDYNGFVGDSVNLKGMLEILSKEKVISFFNIKAGEDTGFAKFKDDVVENYEKITEEISEFTEYSVLCYPNFTVIPSRETDRLLLKAQTFKGEEVVPDTYISINAVYVDAAYVAAGIMVASQNKSILKAKGYALRKAYPCTRFDLETEYSNFLTFFNMENFMNWSDSFEEKLDEKKIGFCFSSNDRIVNGKKLKKTYFYFVRNNNGEPLYTLLTERAIDYYFKELSKSNKKFSMDDCKEAKDDIMKKLDKLCKTSDKTYANLILRPDEGESLEVNSTHSGISIGIKFAELSSVRSVVVSRNKKDDD